MQTHAHPELIGRTLLEVLHRGDEHRDGMPREQASRVLDRYELAHAAEQRFESLSGGQQARFQILLLELSGATLLLLDEPTDNLDVESAEALEQGLESFEGTVLAVTHDRWFARGFDRFLVYGADGSVYESPEPVWDESASSGSAEPGRLARAPAAGSVKRGSAASAAACSRRRCWMTSSARRAFLRAISWCERSTRQVGIVGLDLPSENRESEPPEARWRSGASLGTLVRWLVRFERFEPGRTIR